uniref:NADH dehydrogenase subunit 2 n=1 Tax=Calolamprodes beybienkoi TaxID=3037038 RepID=UPI0027A0E3D0|nr:NADH dehydrogenase subunit 2 [Calolamprodes beybienkoi]WGO57158.1 NADH dehydrogenase subunit 2 [Calolamprodes beybienkoi]
MLNNSTKILFTFTLMMGLLIVISSNSWLSAWMGLEINLLSFIPLMSNNDNILTTEASLKYFLVQALTSASLLFIILSKSLFESMFSIFSNSMSSTMIMIPLLMKSGVAPLHWWFPSVMEGLSWNNCFILMTMQKIAPLLLISYVVYPNMPFNLIILLSVIVGALGGFNQTSIRKILTYSSINHVGWMLAAMLMGKNMWMTYFSIYLVLTLTVILIISPMQMSFINQIFMMNEDNKIMKFLLFSSLLSLGGLPPFLGFLPKWLIVMFMMTNYSFTLISIMTILSLITFYYYLRITYSSFIILSMESNWNNKSSENKTILLFPILMTMISIMGLIFSTLFIILL